MRYILYRASASNVFYIAYFSLNFCILYYTRIAGNYILFLTYYFLKHSHFLFSTSLAFLNYKHYKFNYFISVLIAFNFLLQRIDFIFYLCRFIWKTVANKRIGKKNFFFVLPTLGASNVAGSITGSLRVLHLHSTFMLPFSGFPLINIHSHGIHIICIVSLFTFIVHITIYMISIYCFNI